VTYRRLMEAERQLEHIRERRGVESPMGDVLDSLEPEEPNATPPEDLYLSALTRFVAALGGYVEIRAVFDDETVTLLPDPGAAKRAVG
jgi:hypothetical protein